MKLVFAGTPDFAVPALDRLIRSDHDVAAVLTQPDRRSGRGRKPACPPVKTLAVEHGIEVFQPRSLEPLPPALATLEVDCAVVVAYGLILRGSFLGWPRLGCINVHASLLPRWRGAAPVARAIEAGDRRTGVSIMQMDRGLDTGPVLATASREIGPRDTTGSLGRDLAVMGADLLAEVLDDIDAHLAAARPQPDEGATYARKLSKAEAAVDWSAGAGTIERKIRALVPWPVCESRSGKQRLRIWAAEHPTDDGPPVDAAPGTIINACPGGIDVACGSGVIRLTRLQRDGGKPVSAGEFLNGFALAAGQVLGG